MTIPFGQNLNRKQKDVCIKKCFQNDSSCKNMETVSYGAQLSFLHCMDAFEEESRPMVEFLSAYTMECGSCYQIGTGSYASCFDDRYVMISVQNMDEFLRLLAARSSFVVRTGEKKTVALPGGDAAV